MTRTLFDAAGLIFEETTELERQVVATFAFGMCFAVGQVHKLSPAEVHALAIACLQDQFKYSDQQAVDFAAHLVAVSANPSEQPVMNAIIHQGIDGHFQWQAGDNQGLSANVRDVLARVAGQQ